MRQDDLEASAGPEVRPRLITNVDEGIAPKEAAALLGKSPTTIRRWSSIFGIGELLVGRWVISRVGLRLLLNNEDAALQEFKRGNRSHPAILAAYHAEGLAPPVQLGR